GDSFFGSSSFTVTGLSILETTVCSSGWLSTGGTGSLSTGVSSTTSSSGAASGSPGDTLGCTAPNPVLSNPKLMSIPYSGSGGSGARQATITASKISTAMVIPAVDFAAMRLFFFSCSDSIIV